MTLGIKTRRIWHLCSNRWNSAMTEYALRSAQSLALRGWETFYSPLANSPGAARAAKFGLAGPAFSSFSIKALPSFLHHAGRIKPDVIMLYGGPETFLAQWLPSVKQVRFRGIDRDLTAPLSPWRTRLGLQACDAVVTPSRVLQERFRAVLPKTPVWAVPLGLDAEQFHWQPAEPLQIERPTLRIVGRFDPVKGHGSFFLWYRLLLDRWSSPLPKPFLEVIGEAANISGENLRSFARDVGLVEGQDWSLREERVENLPEVMRQTHLGVIPSQGSEVIGRVAEEFLLCGCPIFISGVGSLEECLLNPGSGASYRGLASTDAIELMAKWLQRSYQESAAEKEARAQLASEHFSLQAMGMDLEKRLGELGV